MTDRIHIKLKKRSISKMTSKQNFENQNALTFYETYEK